MSSEFDHQPVLLHESVTHLGLHAGSVVIDGTLGGGGHAAAILERTGPDGVLIGLDLDPDARTAASKRLVAFGDRPHVVQASFRTLDTAAGELGFERVDGVLLDLGVSSHQLDDPSRGFRFSQAGAESTPLDMRMDPSAGSPASELLRRASIEELERWFREYGELRGARRLARAITQTRESAPLESAADLLRVVRAAGVGRGRKHNPATLVFQALRIAVNDELNALRDGLDAAIQVLRPGGRLVVIAYHSLEDRIVKQRFRAAQRGCICPPSSPMCVCGQRPTLQIVTRRPISPDEAEITANPRARSAKLRAAERLPEPA